MAEVCVASVGGGSSDGVGRVEVLDGEIDTVLLLGVGVQVADHELGKVHVLLVATFIDHILLDAELLPHDLFFLIN